MNKRPMPEDFREHATEPIKDLTKRYRTSCVAVRRWRAELGMPQTTYQKRMMEQIGMTGEVIQTFENAGAAGRELGVDYRLIYMAAKEYPYRTAYGYRWRFV